MPFEISVGFKKKKKKSKNFYSPYLSATLQILFYYFFFNLFFIFLMLFLFDYILFLFMYVCMYVWLCWVFVSVRGLSLVVASRGHSSSRCAGLSPSRPLVAKHRLQTRRPSNCGSRAKPLRGMWDLPRPGLEPTSPALAGKLSTTAPPGKPYTSDFKYLCSGSQRSQCCDVKKAT